MKMNALSTGVLVAIISIGIAGSAAATPDKSQRLRGLAERVFHVTVEVTKDDFGVFEAFFGAPVGTTFPNCYEFAADADVDGNNWSESAFPTVGFWSQASTGAKTSYVVTNLEGFEQLGQVTPARGKGVLQLKAVSTIAAAGLEFVSIGAEVQGSDIDDCPTFPPEFTLPDTP